MPEQPKSVNLIFSEISCSCARKKNEGKEQVEYEKKLTHFLGKCLPLYGKVLHIYHIVAYYSKKS